MITFGAKSFRGKSLRLGGGGRFAKLVAHGVPPGKAAQIGRNKYGKSGFAKLAALGRRRAAMKRKKAFA